MSRTLLSPARPASAPTLLAGLLPVAALLAGACTGAPPPPDLDSLLAGLDTDLPDAERTCLQQQCADVTSADALATCREERCPAREDQWAVVPETIRHDDEMVFVQARLSYAPGGYGPVDAPREREAYVGCTLITSDNQEIDLAVTTVFPSDLERPFSLTSEVGTDVQDVIFGVWDHKITPCDSERMGCREYGFLLGGSLASWPADFYTNGTRQRIPPDTVSLTVLDGGVGDELGARKAAVVSTLDEQLALFGSKVGEARVQRGQAAYPELTVAHRHAHDKYVARDLLLQVDQITGDKKIHIEHRPELSADFVVQLPGSAEAFEATASCADKTDDAYLACLQGT